MDRTQAEEIWKRHDLDPTPVRTTALLAVAQELVRMENNILRVERDLQYLKAEEQVLEARRRAREG